MRTHTAPSVTVDGVGCRVTTSTVTAAGTYLNVRAGKLDVLICCPNSAAALPEVTVKTYASRRGSPPVTYWGGWAEALGRHESPEARAAIAFARMLNEQAANGLSMN